MDKFSLKILVILFIIDSINGQCNVCNTNTKFACFSSNQYFQCDSTGVINLQTLATCPVGTACNQNFVAAVPCGNGLVASCQTGQVIISSTTTTTAIPTTPLASFNADRFCSKRIQRRYPHPSFLTCQNYVYCYVLNSTMKGADYACPDATKFNPTTLLCDPKFSC